MQVAHPSQSNDIEAITRLPLFADVSNDTITAIATAARRRICQRGEIVHHIDDVAGDVFVILKGHVKHRIQAVDGRQFTHSIQGPGGYFGELSIIDGKRRASDAVALTSLEVLLIDRDIIGDFLDCYPAAKAALLRRSVGYLRRLEGLLQDQIFLNVPMRLAKVLLEYGAQEPGSTKELTIPSYLNQTELAFLLGTSRESANLTLKQFVARGWVLSDRKQIRILDADALRLFAMQ